MTDNSASLVGTRAAIKALLIDHGVTDISGALLNELAAFITPTPSTDRDKLLTAAMALRDDLLMRGEREPDGTIVVNASAGRWMRFNEAIDAALTPTPQAGDALTSSGNDVLREALKKAALDLHEAAGRFACIDKLDPNGCSEATRAAARKADAALSTTPTEAEKVGFDAAIRTAESHARMRHKPSAEYTGMAVFQDGLRAYRAALTKEPSQ